MISRSKPIRRGHFWRRGRCCNRIFAIPPVAVIVSFAVTHAGAQTLSPTSSLMNVFHAPRINNAAVPETQANAFTILTNGIVNRGAVDRIDSWHARRHRRGERFRRPAIWVAEPFRLDHAGVRLSVR